MDSNTAGMVEFWGMVLMVGIITLTVLISIGIAVFSSDSFKEKVKTFLKVFITSWVIGIGLWIMVLILESYFR